MHNIKEIRKDFNNIKEKLKNRNIDTDLDSITELLSDIETGKMANKMINALKKSKGITSY